MKSFIMFIMFICGSGVPSGERTSSSLQLDWFPAHFSASFLEFGVSLFGPLQLLMEIEIFILPKESELCLFFFFRLNITSAFISKSSGISSSFEVDVFVFYVYGSSSSS
ncbi:unnamed protein product [Pleuronectes platessa]|uniref:Secreted protein n=1 Tax=Pleuronectes platessa TaxID=8262 RepID=A0A9N7UHA5_PLEPL|nr:unnamed protein product [Pleuronectes platessa]